MQKEIIKTIQKAIELEITGVDLAEIIIKQCELDEAQKKELIIKLIKNL